MSITSVSKNNEYLDDGYIWGLFDGLTDQEIKKYRSWCDKNKTGVGRNQTIIDNTARQLQTMGLNTPTVFDVGPGYASYLGRFMKGEKLNGFGAAYYNVVSLVDSILVRGESKESRLFSYESRELLDSFTKHSIVPSNFVVLDNNTMALSVAKRSLEKREEKVDTIFQYLIYNLASDRRLSISADCVVCYNVLEWCVEPELALKNASEMVAEGGVLSIASKSIPDTYPISAYLRKKNKLISNEHYLNILGEQFHETEQKGIFVKSK